MTTSTIAVVGLGYVGLPVAVEFGKILPVIGFDISKTRVEELKSGHDITEEVSSADLKAAKHLVYTDQPEKLETADVVIICVPTPVDDSKQPDFTPLLKASETVGRHLKKGAIIVYESTVYPGATEEICIPIVENISGKVWKKDFFVGYSPERINPGDKVHTLATVVKVVSGDTPETLSKLADLYAMIVKAGVHRAESIKVAEAAKIIENTQRDVNIALMNEFAMIFQKMKIDTRAVLDAAGTKWNFLHFKPGLVGGHCIGVDPYYLTYKSELLGHHPKLIIAGRATNDGMGKYIADHTIKSMIQSGLPVKDANIGILGLTFKENVSDLRNSRVIDIIKELQEYGCSIHVCDPNAEPEEAYKEYGVRLTKLSDFPSCTCLVAAVAHQEFMEMNFTDLTKSLVKGGVFIDVKAAFERSKVKERGFQLWRL